MSTIKKLKEIVAEAEIDATAFYEKGNFTAGTRLRKAYQEIKILAQTGRAEIIRVKKRKIDRTD